MEDTDSCLNFEINTRRERIKSETQFVKKEEGYKTKCLWQQQQCLLFAGDTMDVHVNRQFASFYLSFVLFYLVPVLLSTALYAAILRIIQKREQNIRQLGQPISQHSAAGGGGGGDNASAVVANAAGCRNGLNNSQHDKPMFSGDGAAEGTAEAGGVVSCSTSAKKKKSDFPHRGGTNKTQEGSASREAADEKKKSSNVVVDERVRKLMNLRKVRLDCPVFLYILVIPTLQFRLELLFSIEDP